MRVPGYLCLLLATISCSALQSTDSDADSLQAAGQRPPFREECVCFESLIFNDRTASSLSGHSFAETDRGFVPLDGVQVAARSLSSGDLRYTLTMPDGSFKIAPLPDGYYEVWTCLDGFDEVRFRLMINQDSEFIGVDFHLRASEAGAGRVAVVPVKGE